MAARACSSLSSALRRTRGATKATAKIFHVVSCQNKRTRTRGSAAMHSGGNARNRTGVDILSQGISPPLKLVFPGAVYRDVRKASALQRTFPLRREISCSVLHSQLPLSQNTNGAQH